MLERSKHQSAPSPDHLVHLGHVELRAACRGHPSNEPLGPFVRYHHRRRNHSEFMRGRTPAEVLDAHRKNRAA
jgi:hypothetical protein